MISKLKKCNFAQPSVKFLGQTVSNGGMSAVKNKVDAIKLLPEPTTKKLLRSF